MITILSNFRVLSLFGAVINDTNNTNNLNIIILGMIIVILILAGAALFAPKR
jgi:LPXTG-motif cell wall-anchored protein